MSDSSSFPEHPAADLPTAPDAEYLSYAEVSALLDQPAAVQFPAGRGGVVREGRAHRPRPGSGGRQGRLVAAARADGRPPEGSCPTRSVTPNANTRRAAAVGGPTFPDPGFRARMPAGDRPPGRVRYWLNGASAESASWWHAAPRNRGGGTVAGRIRLGRGRPRQHRVDPAINSGAGTQLRHLAGVAAPAAAPPDNSSTIGTVAALVGVPTPPHASHPRTPAPHAPPHLPRLDSRAVGIRPVRRRRPRHRPGVGPGRRAGRVERPGRGGQPPRRAAESADLDAELARTLGQNQATTDLVTQLVDGRLTLPAAAAELEQVYRDTPRYTAPSPASTRTPRPTATASRCSPSTGPRVGWKPTRPGWPRWRPDWTPSTGRCSLRGERPAGSETNETNTARGDPQACRVDGS